MQIIRNLSTKPQLHHQRTILTIGSYDGIHRGHQEIIKTLKQSATKHNALTALITFYPRPKSILSPHLKTDYLTTVDEKLLIFAKLGLDITAILPFSVDFAQTPARKFIEQVVNAFHPIELWVGPDFKLGKGREGDIPYLQTLGQEFDFLVKVINLQLADDKVISSTRIRESLAKGQIKEVTELLGRYPFLLGKVVKGAQRGQKIGFPTANVAFNEEKLLPANGVYAVWITINQKHYAAVANIGVRPTFNEDVPTIEVHIFDFNQDIYGEMVQVDLVKYLRPETKFNGLPELIAQINKDVQSAKQILATERSKF